MNQFLRSALIAIAACVVGASAAGQTSSLSLDDYAALMKSNQKTIDAVDAAVAAGKFADARPEVATLRRNFMALRGFWSSRSRTDAVRIVTDGLNRFASIEELLSRPEPSAERIKAATMEFRTEVCGACHRTYREGAPESGFRFKAGVL